MMLDFVLISPYDQPSHEQAMPRRGERSLVTDKQECDSDPNYIYSVSRSDLIRDGVLVAVDQKDASRAGIQLPTALTRSVYERYVKVPDGDEYSIQSESERLWDVLYMFIMSVTANPPEHGGFIYQFFCNNPGPVHENERMTDEGRLVSLKGVVGEDDHGGPTINIMLPSED